MNDLQKIKDLTRLPEVDLGASTPEDAERSAVNLTDVAVALAEHIRLLVIAPLCIGLLALAASAWLPPVYTATTTILPPQPAQSSTAASALASLGALAGLTGAGGAHTPADQYIGLMRSVTVSDRIIDQFKLMQWYEHKFRDDTRKALSQRVRFSVGKKDGLISIEVDDESPQRAAEIANRYVDELRRMTDTIAVGEAQQRRVFFERQLEQARDRLTHAQQALQASGLTQGALKTEPRTAAEGYARLKDDIAAAEVRLQTLRGNLSDAAPEVLQQQAALTALRAQLAKLELSTDVHGGPDYVSKYREFKYQETLFDLFARQYELARADESREGALIQVVDPAVPPERKSKPSRRLLALEATLASAVLLALGILLRRAWRHSQEDPIQAERIARLRAALRRPRERSGG
jgi:uncharacterized protein involved in exopolysaccharide biosynthesis